ncbi:MAG TPA: polysaccharide biosynthesis C-terminal domain-containing protein, partial [Clostridia bacterium]|nr:polysaccharide biosynthesis C-terminal domain-containing protein [Clostridia bacterium]
MVLAVIFRRFELTAVCLIAPIQVLANQMSSVIMIEDVKYKNVIFFTARIVNTTVIILAFFTLSPTLLVAMAMIVIGDVITIVFAARRLRRFGNPFRADLQFLRKILWFSIVAMAITLLLTLNYRVDEMMLKWMSIEDTQRGFYGTGASLAAYGWLISDAFREVLFSRAAKGDAVGELAFSLKINFYITLVMLGGIVLFGKMAIFILYGEPYLPAYPVSIVLLSGVLSMSYFKLIGTLLLAEGKKGVCVVTLAVSALINILANLYAIPRWGIMGAAWASVISYTIAGAVYLGYFVVHYKVPLSSLFVIRKEEIRKLTKRIRRQPA